MINITIDNTLITINPENNTEYTADELSILETLHDVPCTRELAEDILEGCEGLMSKLFGTLPVPELVLRITTSVGTIVIPESKLTRAMDKKLLGQELTVNEAADLMSSDMRGALCVKINEIIASRQQVKKEEAAKTEQHTQYADPTLLFAHYGMLDMMSEKTLSNMTVIKVRGGRALDIRRDYYRANRKQMQAMLNELRKRVIQDGTYYWTTINKRPAIVNKKNTKAAKVQKEQYSKF